MSEDITRSKLLHIKFIEYLSSVIVVDLVPVTIWMAYSAYWKGYVITMFMCIIGVVYCTSKYSDFKKMILAKAFLDYGKKTVGKFEED